MTLSLLLACHVVVSPLLFAHFPASLLALYYRGSHRRLSVSDASDSDSLVLSCPFGTWHDDDTHALELLL
jgi:hypothetical protein